MSKSTPVKSKPQYRLANLIQQAPVVHKSGIHMAVSFDNNETYSLQTKVEDFNQNTNLHLRKQKQQFLFALSFFILAGMLILASQVISKPRSVASINVNLQDEAAASSEK